MDIGADDRQNRQSPSPESGAGNMTGWWSLTSRQPWIRLIMAFLMKAVRSHIKEDWILLYIERWLTAPFETTEGTQLPRERGTPQGGVVSPILMNLFMHYAFDVWMKRSNPLCPFARYADDAVVHCSSRQQAEQVMRSIALRLAECGLTMHPEKSKIVYCQDSNRTESFQHMHFTLVLNRNDL
jgi:retron-type reverse transcriptase